LPDPPGATKSGSTITAGADNDVEMADPLKMETWTHAANRLYHLKKQTCVKTQDAPFSFQWRLKLIDFMQVSVLHQT
jgi:hypothetical protein